MALTDQQYANQYANQAAVGQANFPAFQSQTLQDYTNQGNLSGAAAQQGVDYNTFASMFANDPMGQQFMASNFNNTGSIGSPTGTTVGQNYSTSSNPALAATLSQVPGMPQMPTLTAPTLVSTLPQATVQNLQGGFQGFTDPNVAAQARSQSLADVSGVMQNINQLIGSDWLSAQNAESQTSSQQLAKIQALTSLANFYQNQVNASSTSGGAPSAAELQQQTAQSIASDIKSKKYTLQQLMEKYVMTGKSDANTVVQDWVISGNTLNQQQLNYLQSLGVTTKDFQTTPTVRGTGANEEQLINGQWVPVSQSSGSGNWLSDFYNALTGNKSHTKSDTTNQQPGYSSSGQWSVIQ